MKNKIIGIALPIIPEMFNKLKERDKTIFFKFMPHQTFPKKLKEEDKMFFYSLRKMVGEAKVKNIHLMIPSEIINKYSKEILIGSNDFARYTEGRQEKKALVLVLEKIKMYKKPIDLDFYVTMGGRYIFDSEYNSWKKK
jgi:hypothetical protein